MFIGSRQHVANPKVVVGFFVVLLTALAFGYFRKFLVSYVANDISVAKQTITGLDLGLMAGTKVILNIGSNLDPILPRLHVDDICTSAIAFEPIVHNQIPVHPALHILPAAVSSRDGLSSMHLYNSHGESSSFSVPRMDAKWNSGKRDKGIKVVPVMSMSTVMDSLENYEVGFIVTDMQGFDFAAVSSVKPEIWKTVYKVPHMKTEVYLENIRTYIGVSNDLCRDWLPYMREAGYIFEGLSEPIKGYDSQSALEKTCLKHEGKTGNRSLWGNENDAFWRHFAIPSTANLSLTYDYPRLTKSTETGIYDSREYAECFKRFD